MEEYDAVASASQNPIWPRIHAQARTRLASLSAMVTPRVVQLDPDGPLLQDIHVALGRRQAADSLRWSLLLSARSQKSKKWSSSDGDKKLVGVYNALADHLFYAPQDLMVLMHVAVDVFHPSETLAAIEHLPKHAVEDILLLTSTPTTTVRTESKDAPCTITFCRSRGKKDPLTTVDLQVGTRVTVTHAWSQVDFPSFHHPTTRVLTTPVPSPWSHHPPHAPSPWSLHP